MRYVQSLHLHLGYYDSAHDFEATVLLAEEQDTWHVFFPFENYGLVTPSGLRDAARDPDFGTVIFVSRDKKALQRKFTRWVEKELLPKGS